jgi:uncharacterized protein YcsI (UPF0317 family)
MANLALQPRAAWDRDDPRAARRAIRAALHTEHTAGIAPGYVQGNLCILPKDWADEFLLFCQRNPKPCPLLAVGDAGDPRLPSLAPDLDIRTDVPGYRVFRDGVFVEERTEIGELWRDDLVAFVLGCSFSFEEALLEAGIPLKHIARGACVAMYRTAIDCAPAGRFRGKLVVSMRPLRPADAIRAIQVTSRFPDVHGAHPHRQAGADRRRSRRALSRHRGQRGRGGRAAGLLGLRRHPAIGRRRGEAAALHHPFPGQDAGDRPQERRARGLLGRKARSPRPRARAR